MYLSILIAGANNHKYFMGFLACLVLMCSQMLYGSAHFWEDQCRIFAKNDGFWEAIVKVSQCDPWVAWVAANAVLHLAWVFMLFICQLYQVFLLYFNSDGDKESNTILYKLIIIYT